jgi:hypothetical protein
MKMSTVNPPQVATIAMAAEHLPKVDLRAQIDHRINFAMQQNDVSVVKIVHIENGADAPLYDLRLRITSEPAFADPWEARIALITEKSTYNLEAVDLVLSPRYLGELTERVRGQLRFELLRGEERLLERVEPVELLARDEWSGLASLPEILAAFVMPNHPSVEQILRAAADILGGWTGDPSLSGYQSKDPGRVYTTARSDQAQKMGYVWRCIRNSSCAAVCECPRRVAKLSGPMPYCTASAQALKTSRMAPCVVLVP